MACLVSKYINLTNRDFIGLGILSPELSEEIISYQDNFLMYYNNPSTLKLLLDEKISKYVDSIYSKLCIENVDINYYLEHINIVSKVRFYEITKILQISHTISMMDHGTKDKNTYKYFSNEYYKYFNLKILNSQYSIKKQKKKLIELVDENWSNINFDNLINFTTTLNRLKYFDQDVSIYAEIYENKFNSKESIKKLVSYIIQNFVDPTELEENYNFEEENDSNKKYNFRFIVDNIKSNGFALFEEYYEQLINRYKHSIAIEQIKNDKNIILYFMKIISQKESTSVNRFVNEMLIKIRDYIYDLEDSYNNNHDYQKIRIETQSDKYKDFDLSTLKREKYNFTMIKYLFGEETIKNYILNQNIEPYFDIYRSHYYNRYPDRQISYDIIKSNITVELKYNDQTYFIHMAIIQYLVLYRIINNSHGLTINQISEETGILVGELKETINSLIKIKLIGKTGGNLSDIETIRLIQNPNFSYDKNKISIYSLVQKEKQDDKIEKPKEFLHDRNTIVYSNLIDWIKKNKFFYKDTLIDSIKYKIPFGITDDQIEYSINKALNDDIIKKINISNNPLDNEKIMYQYSD